MIPEERNLTETETIKVAKDTKALVMELAELLNVRPDTAINVCIGLKLREQKGLIDFKNREKQNE